MESKIRWIISQHDRVNQLYDGLPYSVHLIEVVKFIKQFIHLIPEELRDIVILAGWGHDLIEDTGLTFNDVKKELGVDAAELIFLLSNEKGKTRSERANDIYYGGIKNNHLANYIKICDRLGNMSYSYIYGGSMINKYQKELSHFKSSIYNGMYDEMWNLLENINTVEKDKDVYTNIEKFDKITVFKIHLPQLIPASLYKELYSKGVIPKKDLQKHEYYQGKCRNAEVALWNGFKFVYMRTKFDRIYPEDIYHLEDDNGFDLFVPIEQVKPTEEQRVKY